MQNVYHLKNGIQAIQSHGAVGRRHLASRAPRSARHHHLPGLLSFYKEHKDQITAIDVECKDLAYVSSAGLRILLMMCKGGKDGVVLHHVNDTVREVLAQTGIGDLLTIN